MLGQTTKQKCNVSNPGVARFSVFKVVRSDGKSATARGACQPKDHEVASLLGGDLVHV